jgi:hypothetical protein
MEDPELKMVLDQLETSRDMTLADLDGVAHALAYLLPELAGKGVAAQAITTTDGVMQLVDDIYPDWSVHVHGRANDRDGHWRCTLRENDTGDDDAVIGTGRAPVLSQAVLAALLHVAKDLKPTPGAPREAL